MNDKNFKCTVGLPDQPVDAYFSAETLEWLHAQIAADGVAILDNVELETEDGTIVFEASDGRIEMRYKDGEENE